jgi:class 3 adenylate cyclase
MDFYAVLDAVLELLQRHKRVTYRALKRQFGLDDAYLEDLKAEIIEARQLAVDQDGTMLVWCGDVTAPPLSTAAPASMQNRTPLAYTPQHLAEKILTSRSALEGERKQVTVLFADVAGFTTLAEQLDPEVVHDLINRCFEGITAEVHRFEGTINQYTGDGVMALFGAPIAHEDSPRRAVHAALGIQRAIRDVAQALQAERGLSLQMRIGINTGLVVVGKIGDDLRMDYTAVGGYHQPGGTAAADGAAGECGDQCCDAPARRWVLRDARSGRDASKGACSGAGLRGAAAARAPHAL